MTDLARWLWPGFCLLVVALAACASPAEEFARRAESLGLRSRVVEGTVFPHVIYENAASGPILHIYLDGDGTPSIGRWPATDPTPRRPLLLSLMAQDPAPSLYLGRPCYHGLVVDPPCDRRLWTTARYSEEVVASMAAALRRRLDNSDVRQLAFFGHSGGGVLALLLAERFSQTSAVVTIAANLDPDAWADAHGLPPLKGSLNPAKRPPLPPGVWQRHYVGGRDRVVPLTITAPGITAAGAELVVVKGYDHVCCWERLWPDVLAELAKSRA